MIRSLDRYFSVEMFSLWLIEFVLLAATISFLFTMGPGASYGSWQLVPQAATTGIVLAITISIVSVALGLYRSDVCFRARQLVVNASVVGVLAFTTITLLDASRLLAFKVQDNEALLNKAVFQAFVGWIACLFVTRFVFGLALRLDWFTRRIVVVGSSWSAARVQDIINARQSGFCEVIGHLSHDETATSKYLSSRKIWALVVADEEQASTDLELRDLCRKHGALVLAETAFRELRLQKLDTDTLPDDWVQTIESRRQTVVFRLFDLAVSLAFFLCTLPVMLITATAIRLSSKGPIFYGQERVGLNGRTFTLWKFRSMRVDAEAIGKPVWAAKNDPRVTVVGRFIRRSRIDELPQLLNVITGEMSFIGPRPERPVFVEQLTRIVPHYGDRTVVKPGITGWAQVNFPYGASIEDAREKLSYDLYYVKHRSILLHLLILVATIRVIIFQEGSR